MSEVETPDQIFVIPPDLLAKASAEEQEAYFQYLLQEVKRIDDWEAWIRLLFPQFATKPFSQGHRDFWEWVWEVGEENKPRPWISIWPRGHAKSTSAELAVTALAARGKRKYVLYVAETQDQADDHVANIASMLESSSIESAYPDLGTPAVNKLGQSKGWRRNRIVTASGFVLDACGLDSAARGIKFEAQRPDFMCHEIGTEIRDGAWVGNVEDHPGLLQIKEAEGLEVKVWGIPTSEVVTREHRYWVKKFIPRESDRHLETPAGWTEAENLTTDHYIGTPIDMTIDPLPSISHYVPGAHIKRGDDGRIVSSEGAFEEHVPKEFLDPEWWWFFGLWWGDGHLNTDYQVAVTIADHEPWVADKVRNLLDRYGIAYTVSPRVGCSAYIFSKAWMVRWLRSWKYEVEGQSSHGLKSPPAWVEKAPFELQAALIRGYVDADGYVTNVEVKVTSVSYKGLLSAKRILARLGVAASIRDLRPAGHTTICGVETNTKRAYDLRFGQGREILGLPKLPPPRYRFTRTFLNDGWLWHKVRSSSDVGPRKFAPVNVGESHSYLTDFGVSHNCFDDIDGELDTEAITNKKIKVITQKLFPAGAPNCAMLMVQNLVHENSIFAQLADDRADFLMNRIVSGPIKAVEDMRVEQREQENESGQVERRWVITEGKATWPEGFPIDVCEALINEFGLTAFMAECQHETTPPDGDIFAHLHFDQIEVDEEDLPAIKRTVVFVDPAVSSTDTADSMGIQIDSLGVDRKIYRRWSWEQRSTPLVAIKKAIEKAIEYNAQIVGIEVNQGKETWRVVYDQAMMMVREEQAAKEDGDFFRKMPRYKEVTATKDLGSKVNRAERMLVDYERDVFRHVRGTHHTLVASLKRFPRVKPFDLVDASYWSWNELAGPLHKRRARMRSSAKQAMSKSFGIANAPATSR